LALIVTERQSSTVFVCAAGAAPPDRVFVRARRACDSLDAHFDRGYVVTRRPMTASVMLELRKTLFHLREGRLISIDRRS